jgi:hypothetical protein
VLLFAVLLKAGSNLVLTLQHVHYIKQQPSSLPALSLATYPYRATAPETSDEQL